jgi:guanylate kinase
MTKDKGPLIVVSGPAGTGKTTVIDRLLRKRDLPLRLSVSATTRPPRKGEKDGVHYYFWTRERFQEERERGAFLEWATVHDNYYGTLRAEVEPYRDNGIGVILDIDTQGADQVRRKCPELVSVFLEAPSPMAYEERLRKRGTEDEAAIQRRLAAARQELARKNDYDHVVVNDDLDRAVAQLQAIIKRQFQRDDHAG